MPPRMAPNVSWPSAPMFQTLARIADGESGADEHQRRRLDDELLERPERGQRLDEIDIEPVQRIDAAQARR